MAIIAPLPFTLTNGSTADATQVMADFNAIVAQVNANAAHNGANSDITGLSGLTSPISAAQGGTSEYAGGISTGSANAQVVTTLPANFQLLPGNRVTFIAGFTNTGAMTLAVGGQGATSLTMRTVSGLVALQGGEVVSGLVFSAEFDGVQFQLLDPVITIQPAFRATSAGGQAVSSAGTPLKVNCGTVTFDTSTSYDSLTNFRYTPPPGLYQVNGAVFATGGSNTPQLAAIIRKNGSTYALGQTPQSSGGNVGAVVSDLVQLNGTDFIELWTSLSNSGSNVTTSASGTMFSAVRVGR